jgi:hypothetical protein
MHDTELLKHAEDMGTIFTLVGNSNRNQCDAVTLNPVFAICETLKKVVDEIMGPPEVLMPTYLGQKRSQIPPSHLRLVANTASPPAG